MLVWVSGFFFFRTAQIEWTKKKYFVNRELCGFPAKTYYISMVCPRQPQPQLKLYCRHICLKDVCREILIG